MKKFMMCTVCLFLMLVPNSHAQEGEWEFVISPMVWVPGVDGEFKFITLPTGSSGSPRISLGPTDVLEALDYGGLVATEIRKNAWSLFSDFIFMQLSTSDTGVNAINFGGTLVTSSLNVGTEVELKEFLTTVAGGYRIIENDSLTMDVMGGFRYLWLEAELKWNLAATVTGPLGGGQTFARRGQLTEDADIWNGIAGVRGRINLGDSSWYIPYYADIGAGDSDLTWQLYTAIGYSFESWDLSLGYRHLAFDASDDSFIEDIAFTGPVLGATFRF